MQSTLSTLSIVAALAVAVVLLAGLWNMLRAGDANLSQKFMRWRVLLQFGAIVVAMLFLYVASLRS